MMTLEIDKNTVSKEVGFEPFVIRNFYSKDMIELLKFQIHQFKINPGVEFDNSVFKRKTVHDAGLFQAAHQLMTKRVAEFLNRPLLPSYSFVSMYFEGEGICPPHTDRPQCKYTVDLVIDQKKPWSFFAESIQGDWKKEFKDMEPGDALILSGTHHAHWREQIQPDNFCDLAFFHFVDENFQGGLK